VSSYLIIDLGQVSFTFYLTVFRGLTLFFIAAALRQPCRDCETSRSPGGEGSTRHPTTSRHQMIGRSRLQCALTSLVQPCLSADGHCATPALETELELPNIPEQESRSGRMPDWRLAFGVKHGVKRLGEEMGQAVVATSCKCQAAKILTSSDGRALLLRHPRGLKRG
jgi:hypothetical protein